MVDVWKLITGDKKEWRQARRGMGLRVEPAPDCLGTTAKGEPCMKKTWDESGFCWQHR